MKKILFTTILVLSVALCNAQISSTPLDLWRTKGNKFTTSTNYLGTNSNHALSIRTNSVERINISETGSVNLGTNSFSTSGQSTFSNVVAKGTVSVSSTATLQNNSVLGSASLTGGNSGTVATLGDAVFQTTFFHSASSPADGATLYFGGSGYPLWAVNHSTITLPYNCTLIGWDYNAVVNGVIGTGESATLTIAGTSTAALSTSITYSAASAYNAFSASGLSLNFNAGDKINARLVCPTWATNPTAIIAGLTLWFVRRY